LTPTQEQQLLRDSIGEFAVRQVRPAAAAADDAAATPPELLARANELGLTMVGVPGELGGVISERSATTAVLIAEALARGDMGIAIACLAGAGVATAMPCGATPTNRRGICRRSFPTTSRSRRWR
jgi:alkylation response protein AidB-like acyl-CoA dehydrogenase